MAEEQQHFRGQVIWQRYPALSQDKKPATSADDDPEDTCCFRILTVRPMGAGEKDVVVKCNSFPDWESDDLFEFHGQMVDDPKYGPGFVAETAVRLVPDTIRGIQKYLENHVKGVGKKTAAVLVAKFGVGVIQILDNNPERLAECEGIGSDKAKSIAESWQSQHDPVVRTMELWLAQFDIQGKWAQKFIQTLGRDAQQILQKNPYRSMRLNGIGFKKADEMAARMGWPERCVERTEAAVTFVVQDSTSSGHCFTTHVELVATVRKIASSRKGTLKEEHQLPLEEAEAAIERVVENKYLKLVPYKHNGTPHRFYYLPHIYEAEQRLAQRLAELQTYPHVPPRGIEDTLDRVEADLGMTKNEQQRDAVVTALMNNISVLTGGPGTGKTTTLKMLLRTAKRLGLHAELCAPTGRAAKRMSEVTGEPAQTIHKLLEWDPEEGGFIRDRKTPLSADLLVIDETSMLDVELADSLMDAVPDRCSVVFVGDVDQLPSVGPGMVLADLIKSGVIHVTRLETIFRQAAGSHIVTNAKLIRSGEMPAFPDVKKGKGIDSDSYFMEVPKSPDGKDDVEWIKSKLHPVIQRMVAKHGCDPIKDIQVLTPMKIGPAGFPEFNKVLQSSLNPTGKEVQVKGQKFRVGDRVMQLSNNYQLEIFNGDIGFLLGFDDVAKELLINFYGRSVRYPYKETDDLVLAYAATTHKSQGSEFEYVICIMTMHHWPMLERHLLYTANTRAKKMIVFLASWGAVKKAVGESHTNRNTLLAQRIVKEVKAASLPIAA